MKQLNYEDCVRLSKNPEELQEYLRGRLVQLVGSEGSVAIRAIDILMNLDIIDESEDWDDISTEQLRIIKRRAVDIIKETASERSAEIDGEDTGTADIS